MHKNVIKLKKTDKSNNIYFFKYIDTSAKTYRISVISIETSFIVAQLQATLNTELQITLQYCNLVNVRFLFLRVIKVIL
jgi:hypothetical protein